MISLCIVIWFLLFGRLDVLVKVDCFNLIFLVCVLSFLVKVVLLFEMFLVRMI